VDLLPIVYVQLTLPETPLLVLLQTQLLKTFTQGHTVLSQIQGLNCFKGKKNLVALLAGHYHENSTIHMCLTNSNYSNTTGLQLREDFPHFHSTATAKLTSKSP
jgi:hypothetical protein